MSKKTALIVVDVQNDFCPGGALAVKDGDQIVPIINEMMKNGNFELIVATQDYHPAGHSSFAAQGGIWPDHCVQETEGARFHPNLNIRSLDAVFEKGTNPEVDSYSGFYDNDHKSSTGLTAFLHTHNIEDVVVVGLATDYCVKFTALDAKTEGFNVTVVKNACRAVNLQPDDGEKAYSDMSLKGIDVVKTPLVMLS